MLRKRTGCCVFSADRWQAVCLLFYRTKLGQGRDSDYVYCCLRSHGLSAQGRVANERRRRQQHHHCGLWNVIASRKQESACDVLSAESSHHIAAKVTEAIAEGGK